MARTHRMTPKRKAALRKAQLISARKRRRNIVRAAGGLGGLGVLAGAGAAVYFGHKKWTGTRSVKNAPKAGRELDVIRIAPIVGAKANNWALVGRPARTRVQESHGKHKSERKRPNYVESEALRLKKNKQRLNKNYRARRKYWRAKPIGRRKKGRSS